MWHLDGLENALDTLKQGFKELPESDAYVAEAEDISRVLREVAERLHDNFPYFHPLYAGQMLKPPHPVARLAYALAMCINPNNHARDGGRASSDMEVEAVAEIAAMCGWHQHIGHLCGGGTMANLEALWVSRQCRPDSVVLASKNAHYTHQRISGVLGIDFEAVDGDSRGCMSVDSLRRRLDEGNVGTVVATMGTTGTGSVDPLTEILKLQGEYSFRVHADAAYGGYFRLASSLDDETRDNYAALESVDSIVIDPHKHGLQPYGCGCVLFRDPEVGQFYQHDSPYTYFTSTELHLGEISLECSRPGAGAVALWATQRLLPLARGGEFSGMLDSSLSAATALFLKLEADERFLVPHRPQLDIVIWAMNAESVSKSSKLARSTFEAAEGKQLFLALIELPIELFDNCCPSMQRDRTTITCLRSVLMKAEHEQWVEQIWQRIVDAAESVAEG